MSKPKWVLRPDALLREIPRQDTDAGYRHTICGAHACIWTKLNTDPIKSLLPQKDLEEINELLEAVFLMGKRMDFRLQQYFLELKKGSKADALEHSMTGKFVEKVPKEEWKGNLAPKEDPRMKK